MYYVDLKSLMEFKVKREAKKNKKPIDKQQLGAQITCTNHPPNETVPVLLTKVGYKCVLCQ